MNTLLNDLRLALRGRRPVLYVQSPEEERILQALRKLCGDLHANGSMTTWTCVDGLQPPVADVPDTRDPQVALECLARDPRPGFSVFQDLADFMERPAVVRALRNARRVLLRQNHATLVVVSPRRVLPPDMESEIFWMEAPPPDAEEIAERLQAIQLEHKDRPPVPEAWHSHILPALRGLTLDDVGHTLHSLFDEGFQNEQDVLRRIFEEKKRTLSQCGYLEYVPACKDIDQIGGLEILKDWARRRRGLFSRDAVEAGLPVPKGVLVMGVSGCGKSLSAKALAALWSLPLFRLDMNLVFSGLYGSPESAFHRALKAIESIAPAVLWIDEIENALGMTARSATAEQSLTFSSFLTWMQERPPLVFVAATANRIEALPAEAIRKGRFDEVFFCDLPGENERREIFEVHLRLSGADPATLEIERLMHSTKGWSGAEIEQAVIAARVDARAEQRDIRFEDLRRHAARMVPLSTTMSEQIRAIRSWAYQRATRASKPEPRSMIPAE
jgi:hypothetical protein